MKTTTIHMLVFAFAFTLLLGATSALAADAVQLDQFHAQQGVTCNDCHGDQAERQPVAMIKCLECHDTADVAEATAELKPTNPHNNRHYGTETNCNYCHHQHQKSENFCTPCHLRFTFDVP